MLPDICVRILFHNAAASIDAGQQNSTVVAGDTTPEAAGLCKILQCEGIELLAIYPISFAPWARQYREYTGDYPLPALFRNRARIVW